MSEITLADKTLPIEFHRSTLSTLFICFAFERTISIALSRVIIIVHLRGRKVANKIGKREGVMQKNIYPNKIGLSSIEIDNKISKA